MSPAEPIVGTLNEGSLHAELKQRYSQPGDLLEYPIDQFVADIARDVGTPEQRLIEIQTGSFGAMGTKLDHLLPRFKVTIVHPIALRTRLQRDDRPPRLSPKKGSVYSLFDELVSIPTLLDHPNLTIEVVLFREARVQVSEPSLRRGRGGYRTIDRLVEEIEAIDRFSSMADVMDRFVPRSLQGHFSTADLANELGLNRSVAQRITYCLRLSGHLVEVDRNRDGRLFRRS